MDARVVDPQATGARVIGTQAVAARFVDPQATGTRFEPAPPAGSVSSFMKARRPSIKYDSVIFLVIIIVAPRLRCQPR